MDLPDFKNEAGFCFEIKRHGFYFISIANEVANITRKLEVDQQTRLGPGLPFIVFRGSTTGSSHLQ
jgi:hypothetical protein